MNVAGYQTLIVRYSEPIKALDGIFDDAEAWGVDPLKGWIDSYESSLSNADSEVQPAYQSIGRHL